MEFGNGAEVGSVEGGVVVGIGSPMGLGVAASGNSKLGFLGYSGFFLFWGFGFVAFRFRAVRFFALWGCSVLVFGGLCRLGISRCSLKVVLWSFHWGPLL